MKGIAAQRGTEKILTDFLSRIFNRVFVNFFAIFNTQFCPSVCFSHDKTFNHLSDGKNCNTLHCIKFKGVKLCEMILKLISSKRPQVPSMCSNPPIRLSSSGFTFTRVIRFILDNQSPDKRSASYSQSRGQCQQFVQALGTD